MPYIHYTTDERNVLQAMEGSAWAYLLSALVSDHALRPNETEYDGSSRPERRNEESESMLPGMDHYLLHFTVEIV